MCPMGLLACWSINTRQVWRPDSQTTVPTNGKCDALPSITSGDLMVSAA